MSISRRLRPRWRINWTAVLGVLLIAAAAYTTGTAYQLGEQAQERGDCQARVNTAFLNALVQRDDANRELNEAQRALITAPARDEGPDARARANRRYLQALDEQARARATNPLPEVKPC